MFYSGDIVNLSLPMINILGVVSPDTLPTTSLLFGPIKIIFIVIWFYICMRLVQYVEVTALVPQRYKAQARAFSLFFAPFLLFTLFIADRTKKVQHGKLTVGEVIAEVFEGIFRFGRGFDEPKSSGQKSLELMDYSGRSFLEVYGGKQKDGAQNEIIQLTENIIRTAIDDDASDILIDPKGESIFNLRYRVDGVLKHINQIHADKGAAIINSIKALSAMDIAEKRRPQDGSFTAKTKQSIISFRVASAGVLNGEKLSIRILNKDSGRFTLDNIGMSKKQRLIVQSVIAKPSGMILMCGPTGSGKTTTMYAMLNEIDMYTRNVVTIEDPIEYVLPDASQIEINPKADITFAKSLRSVLRQDPDVICVGEIRDEETAKTALQASQTGHLVLATLHSNSNASTLVRLLDLGISPILISSGLSLVISQRLLRRLCDNCKIPAELTEGQIYEFRKQKVNYINMHQAQGCSFCDETGYKGRIAVCDFLIINETLKAAITSSETMIAQLRSDGNKRGKSNLSKQGMKLVVSGFTSLEELKRVVG